LLIVFLSTAEEAAEEAALFLGLLLLLAILGVLRGIGRLWAGRRRQDGGCNGGRQWLGRTAEAEDFLEEVALIGVGACAGVGGRGAVDLSG
jgi:hypothetical protein